ncbi:MAG: hypothetical protein ACRD2N_15040 [Vicinamibacterales bacterium]
MNVKIHGGTTTDGSMQLCPTCRYATIVRGPRLDQQIVECSQLSHRGQRITFPVVECSSYSDRRQPSLYHMEDIAWVLRSDARRRQIGFVRARDLKHDQRHILDEDDWK